MMFILLIQVLGLKVDVNDSPIQYIKNRFIPYSQLATLPPATVLAPAFTGRQVTGQA